MLLFDQRHQCGKFEQQHQHQCDHCDRPAAWILHDRQCTLTIAESAQPGIGAVGQAVQVQRAAEQHPHRQQHCRVKQQWRTQQQPVQHPQHRAEQQTHQRIKQQRAPQFFRRRHARQANRQAAQELQGDPEWQHVQRTSLNTPSGSTASENSAPCATSTLSSCSLGKPRAWASNNRMTPP
ncbi:hypothetical protein D3C84_818940 [compost metagenome]